MYKDWSELGQSRRYKLLQAMEQDGKAVAYPEWVGVNTEGKRIDQQKQGVITNHQPQMTGEKVKEIENNGVWLANSISCSTY